MKVEIELLSEAIAEDLLWHSEKGPDNTAKALRTAAFYYMTLEQVTQYLGSREEAEEYFR